MFHRILVGIDGSRRTEVIVNAAASLALAAGASVHILCAVDPAYFLEEANGIRPSSTDELDYPAAASERERADNLVRQVVAELVTKGLEASGMVVGGEPVQATLTTAFQLKCDAIVLGHRHLTWLGRMTDRSVCHDLLEQSSIPVLVIPTS